MNSSSQPDGEAYSHTKQLKADHQLHQATMDSSIDMIQVFEAVRNQQGEIIDFIWILNNHASEKIYGNVVGKSLLQLQPGVVKEGIFDAFKQVVETGLPQQYEKHYVHEQFDGWFFQSVVKLNDGVASTTSDITSRKKAEQEVEQSRALLQNIIDTPDIGIAVYKAIRNEDGEITDFLHEYINRASIAMLGEDFTGKLFSDHGENALVQMAQFREVLETGQGNAYIREADFRGRKVWFAITNKPLDDERLVHTWEDITERKHAEAELLQLKEDVARKNTDKYQQVFDSMDEGYYLCEVIFDKNNKPVDIHYLEENAAAVRMIGLSMVGKYLRDFSPSYEEHWYEIWGQVALTGVSQRMEKFSSPNQAWYNFFVSKVGDETSRVVAVVFKDITERVQTEEALRESEARFRRLFTNNMVPMFIWTPEGNTLDANDGFLNLLGYSRAELEAGQCRWDAMTPPGQQQRDAEAIEEVLRLGFCKPYEKPFRHKDGHLVWFFVGAGIFEHHPLSGVCYAIDLTESKKAEEALQESEEKYRTLFETIDEGFCVVELVYDQAGKATDYRYLEVNQVFARQTGITDALGKLNSHVTSGKTDNWLETYDRVAQTGEPTRLEDFHEPTGRWYSAYISRVGDSESRRVSIVFDDITERKAREQQQEFILKISDVIRPLGTAVEIQNQAVQLLRSHFNTGWCFFGEFDETGTISTVQRDSVREGLPSMVGIHDLSGSPEILDLISQDKAFHVPDITQSTLIQQYMVKEYVALGMHAALGIPLVKNGHLKAIFILADSKPREWSEGETALLKEVVERTWTAIERAKVEEALRVTEGRLRTVIQQAPIAIAITGPAGEVLSRNTIYDKIWGRPAHDTSASKYSDVYQGFHLDGRPIASHEWPAARAVLNGEIIQGEVLYNVHLDGRRIPCSYNAAPIRNEAGDITGGVVLFQDVSEELAAQEALRINEARVRWQKRAFQLAINGAPLARSLRVLAEMVAEETNGAARTAFSLANAEGTGLFTVRAAGDMPDVYADDVDGLQIGEDSLGCGLAVPTGEPIVTPDVYQEVRWKPWTFVAERYHITACWSFPIKTKENKAVGSFAMYFESAREATADDLALAEVVTQTAAVLIANNTDIELRGKSEKALLEADRRKDEFLAMLAHELRNSMSTIRSGLQFLSLTASGIDNNIAEIIGMMNRQSDHLVRMVDDLLDVSRISRGKIELKKDRVDLVELANQAAESMRNLYEQQGRTLLLDVPAVPVYMEGDATRLTQVFTNLLTNGARYTETGGKVWMSLKQENNEAVLRVTDNGIGLEASYLSVIFELFVQVDNSLARAKGGLGLGLTLVKTLVDLHGGQVEAQSPGPGQGSTFVVRLPVLESTASGSDTGAQEVHPLLPHRILVIDDNADAAKMLAMLLQLKGFEPFTRNSGQAGIEAFESLRPSFILLDIGMPGLDGYETCRLLRNKPAGKEVFIIALTGYGQDEDRQRTKEAGFDGHLLKPADLDELLNMVSELGNY